MGSGVPNIRLNIAGLKACFIKNFNSFIGRYDHYADSVEIVPVSVEIVDFRCNDYGAKIEYQFDVQINLREKDLLDVLENDIEFCTKSLFVDQAVPRNKLDIATRILRLIKTSNPEWSPKKRVYSDEDLEWVSNLVHSTDQSRNFKDKYALKTAGLSEQTERFLSDIYGKNFYIDSLFDTIMDQFLIRDGTSLSIDQIVETVDQEFEELVREGDLGCISGQDGNFFLEPIAKDDVGEPMTNEDAYKAYALIQEFSGSKS